MSLALVVIFSAGSVLPARAAQPLSPAGEMVRFSSAFIPPQLVGIKVFRDEPFRFDFILDKGEGDKAAERSLQEDSQRLIRYFLASLTVPEKDLWVNLSPEEKDRIIPLAFGLTEMGQDVLAQDYLLKQVSSSALHPDEALGKRFWEEVYRQASERYGTTDIPLDSRNRVWIVPADVTVYEKADAGGGSTAALVSHANLKVMLETDYLALEKQAGDAKGSAPQVSSDGQELTKNVLREIMIPALEKEVNEGAQFSRLRQVYHSFILAAWYKKKLKDSIASSIYVDKNKTSGVDTGETDAPQKIYEQYVASFRKGVFNFVKDEKDGTSGEIFPRKYFSGGIVLSDSAMRVLQVDDMVQGGDFTPERCVIISSMAQPAGQPAVLENAAGVSTPQEALDIEANIAQISSSTPQVVRSFVMNVNGQNMPFEARYSRSIPDNARMSLADIFSITVAARGKMRMQGEVVEVNPEIIFIEYERPSARNAIPDVYLKRAYFKRVGLQGGLFKTFMSMLQPAVAGRLIYSKIEEPETIKLLEGAAPEVRWPELAHSQLRQTLMGRTFSPSFILSYTDRGKSIVGNDVRFLDRVGADMGRRLQALLEQAADVERAYGLRGRQDQNTVVLEALRRTYSVDEIDKMIATFEMFARLVQKMSLFYDQKRQADLGAHYSEIADLLKKQIVRLRELNVLSARQLDGSFVFTEEGLNQVNVSTSSAQQILDAVQARAGEKILDLGSGRGNFVLQATRAGLLATGIELNGEQLRQAQDLVADAVDKKTIPKGRANFLEGDFLSSEISFKDYDILYMFTMLDETSSEKFADKVLQAWQDGASFRFVLYYAPKSDGLIRRLAANKNVRMQGSRNGLIYVFRSNFPTPSADAAQAEAVVMNDRGESVQALMERIDGSGPADLFRALHKVEGNLLLSYPILLSKIYSRDMDFWKILQEPAYRAIWDEVAAWDNDRFEGEWNKVFSAWTFYNVPARIPDIVAELTNGFPEDGNARMAWDHYVGNISSVFVNHDIYRAIRVEQDGDRGVEVFAQDMKAGIMFLELLRRWYRSGIEDSAQLTDRVDGLTFQDYRREIRQASRVAVDLRKRFAERLQNISDRIIFEPLSKTRANKEIIGFQRYIESLAGREESPGLGARFSRGHFRAVRIALNRGDAAFETVVPVSAGVIRLVRLPVFTRYTAPRVMSLMYFEPNAEKGGAVSAEQLVAYGIEEEVDGFPPDLGFDLLPEFRQGARKFSARELYEVYQASILKETGAPELRVPSSQIFTQAVGGDPARTLRFYLGVGVDIFEGWRAKSLTIPVPAVWGLKEKTLPMASYLDWLVYKNMANVFSGEEGLKALSDLAEPLRKVPFFSLAQHESGLSFDMAMADRSDKAVSVEEKEGGVTEITTASGEKFAMKIVDDGKRMQDLAEQWLSLSRDFGSVNREFWKVKMRMPGAFLVEMRSANGDLVGLSLAHRWSGLPSPRGMMEDRYVLALTEIVPSARGNHLGEVLFFKQMQEVLSRSRAMGLKGDVAAEPISRESAGILRKAGFSQVPAWTIFRGEELPEDGVIKEGDEGLLEEWWGQSLSGMERLLEQVYVNKYIGKKPVHYLQLELPGFGPVQDVGATKQDQGLDKTGKTDEAMLSTERIKTEFLGEQWPALVDLVRSHKVGLDQERMRVVFSGDEVSPFGYNERDEPEIIVNSPFSNDLQFEVFYAGLWIVEIRLSVKENYGQLDLLYMNPVLRGQKWGPRTVLKMLDHLTGLGQSRVRITPARSTEDYWYDTIGLDKNAPKNIYAISDVRTKIQNYLDGKGAAVVAAAKAKERRELLRSRYHEVNNVLWAFTGNLELLTGSQDLSPEGLAKMKEIEKDFEPYYRKHKEFHERRARASAQEYDEHFRFLQEGVKASLMEIRSAEERSLFDGEPEFHEWLVDATIALLKYLDSVHGESVAFEQIAPEDVVLAPWMNKTAGMLSLNEGIQLVQEIDPGLHVWADPSKLSNVFVNMIKNSQEAMGAKGGTITIKAVADGQFVRITVADTGSGIAPEDLPRIFDRDFTKGKAQGTGIGLDIVRTIVQAHGGTITAESRPGEGATFILRLPADQAMDGGEQKRALEVQSWLRQKTGKDLWQLSLTPEDIQDLRDSDGEAMLVGRMALKMDDFSRAFHSGTPIAFDLSAVAQDRDPIDVLIMFQHEMNLKVGVLDWENAGPAYVLQELFKNALIHGNHFDLRLPVYIYADLNDRQEISRIHVIDTASDRQIEAPVMKALLRNGLTGAGKGIELASAGRQYERQDVQGLNGERIGQEAVIAWSQAPAVSSDSAMRDGVERLQLKDEKIWLAVRDGIGAQIKDGDRVLEIGTGIQGVLTARLAESVGKKKVDFVATDIDQESADGARKALKEYPNAAVLQGDLFEPVKEQKFNAIFWNPPWYGAEREGKRNSGAYLDEDYRNLRRFLKEAPEHLLPGGKIFVIFPRELSEILWEAAPEVGLEITEHPEPRHANPATEARVRQHVMVYEFTSADDAMKGGTDLGDKAQDSAGVAEGAGGMSSSNSFRRLAALSRQPQTDEQIFSYSNEGGYYETLRSIRLLDGEVKQRKMYIGISGAQNLDFMAARHSDWGVLMDINKRTGEFFSLFKKIFSDSPELSREEFIQELFRRMDGYAPAGVDGARYFENSHQNLMLFLTHRDSWLADDDRYEHIKKMFLNGRITFIQGSVADAEIFLELGQWMKANGLSLDMFYISNVTDHLTAEDVRGLYLNIVGVADEKTIILDAAGPGGMYLLAKGRQDFSWDVDKGGIDLGAGTMDMSVQREGQEFRFDLNPADLKRYEDAPGLTPVILNIQPLKSLPRFLGSNEKDPAVSLG